MQVNHLQAAVQLDLYYPTVADLAAADLLQFPPRDGELSFRIKAAPGTRAFPPDLIVASYDVLMMALKGASFVERSYFEDPLEDDR